MLRELTSLQYHSRRGRSKLLLLGLAVAVGLAITLFASYLHNAENFVLRSNQKPHGSRKLRQNFYQSRPPRPYPISQPHLLQDWEDSELDIDDDFEESICF